MMAALGDLRWMLPPLVMCLVLLGIHGYLGLHVISRKVIFVDLALAQIAALGSVVAVLLGYDPVTDATTIYFFSLGFTFFGAAVFSLTRMRHEKVPQEAFIGIVYATASAVALLLLSKASGEAEHIKEMLVGNVLLETWPHIAKVAALYAVISAFHWIFRKPFLEISADPEAALARGRNVRLWDFFFYASFGAVITTSVQVAGVLLVFTFLVVPAVIAFMYATSTGARIALCWTVGVACSAGGMLLSYHGDLPTGPSVVACFAGLLLLAALAYYVRGAERPIVALGRVAVGAMVLVGVALLASRAGKRAAEHAHGGEFQALAEELRSPDENKQIEAVHHLEHLGDPHAVPLLAAVLAEPHGDRVYEHIIGVLPGFGAAGAPAVPALQALAAHHEDPFIKLEVAEAILKLGSPSGFSVVGGLLDDDPPGLVVDKASQLVKKMTAQDFPLGDPAGRSRFKAWLSENLARVQWRPELQRFE